MSSSTDSARRKFAFDTQFGETVAHEKKSPLRHSDEALEHARAEGFAAGRASYEAEAQRLDRQTSQLIAQHLRTLLETLDANVAPTLHRMGADIGLAVARRAARGAWEARREAMVADFMREAIENVAPRARLLLKVNPAVAPQTVAMIEALVAEENWETRIVVRPDPLLTHIDMAVEWGEGAILFEADQALKTLEDSVRSALCDNHEMEGAP